MAGALLAALVCEPFAALAAAGEQEWDVVAGAEALPIALGDTFGTSIGAQLGGGYRYNITDFWAIDATLTGHAHPDLQFARGVLSARLIVDALTWVPALGVGVGGSTRDGGSVLGAAFAELAWRPSRGSGLVVRITGELHTTLPTSFGVLAGYRWYISDAAGLDF